MAQAERFEVPLSSERLHEVLSYSPETGLFTWRIRISQRCRIADVAGGLNSDGYRHIRVDGRAYKAHRLAFLYMTGAWPFALVDHANGDRADNRWANLRLATRSQNLANSKPHRRGKAAPKGVSLRSRGRWMARIQRDKEQIFLGYFPTEQDAAAAYLRAAHDLFGDFAKGVQL